MTDCTCETTARAGAATEPFDSLFPVPPYPPADWFSERPDWLTPETKIAVDDDGRVAGYFYSAGSCLVHNAAACPKPSPTGYAAFHQQEVAVADGTLVRCGVIGNVNGHADPYATVDSASAHYADPSKQLISCCAFDDEHGGYILGALVPHATYGDVALIRRSALSGDWRPMPPSWWHAHSIAASVVRDAEGYDCIGPTLVTRPGLPLVRSFGRAAALGGMGGVQLEGDGNVTTIDLGNGTIITTNGTTYQGTTSTLVPPGPQPVDEARTAASPPGTPGGPPGAPKSGPPTGSGKQPPASGDGPAQGGDTSARLDQLEQDVAQLKDVVSQLIDAMSQPMAAAAELPPPLEAAPKV
jgi:hypothetical protein